MPPRFSLNIDFTLGVNAPFMSYVITMIHQFIIIEVVEFEKLQIHGRPTTTSWIICNGLN
jgi:hypothetical protein